MSLTNLPTVAPPARTYPDTNNPHALAYALSGHVGRRAEFARNDRAQIAAHVAEPRETARGWTCLGDSPVSTRAIDGISHTDGAEHFGPYVASAMHDAQGVANDYSRRAAHLSLAFRRICASAPLSLIHQASAASKAGRAADIRAHHFGTQISEVAR